VVRGGHRVSGRLPGGCGRWGAGCRAKKAFFLDLRKAYVTVWRNGLLRKLWDMGIRGRMWRYVDALYARSVSVVRVEGQVSQPVEVDLGVAQGDTLSCVLFSLYYYYYYYYYYTRLHSR
jgi:hypothetical protein